MTPADVRRIAIGVRAIDSGDDTTSTMWIARDYLGREQPDDRA